MQHIFLLFLVLISIPGSIASPGDPGGTKLTDHRLAKTPPALLLNKVPSTHPGKRPSAKRTYSHPRPTALMAGVGIGILTPLGAGVATGSLHFPLQGAFDGQPAWDEVAQSPTGGVGGEIAPAYGDRYGYIDFGPNYADTRITGTWTQYRAWSGGDHTPYVALWWDDDTDNINDNGVTETRLNFNSAVGLPHGSAPLWVEDTYHEVSPITPPARYLVCKSPAVMTSRAQEYAIVGFVQGQAPPAAPTDLAVTTTGTTEVTLGWTDHSDDETGFEVERSVSPGTGFSWIHTTVANTTSYTDTGLSANTTYYYRVRAISGAGNSSYSPELMVVTGTDPGGIPCEVTGGFTANAYVNTLHGGTVDADLSWMGLPTAQAYQVSYMTPGFSELTTPETTTPNVTIRSLRPNVTYSWRVRVQCEGEWLPWPTVFETFITPDGSSCEVTGGFTANAYVNTSAGGTVDADLSWTGVPLGEAYQVNYVAPDVFTMTTTTLTSPHTTIRSLSPNTTYSWRVRVQCGGEWASWPMTFETFTTPGGSSCEVTSGFTANAYVNASAGGTVDADLSWVGVPLGEAYQVNYVAPGLLAVTTPVLTSPGVTARSLKPNTTYSWRVRVQCGGEWTPWPMTFETFTTPGGSSCEVTSGFTANAYVNASAGGTVDADLSWDEIPVGEAYQVNYVAPGLLAVTTPVLTSPSVTARSLKPNTTYSWRVRVQCGGEWTPWPMTFETFATPDGSSCEVTSGFTANAYVNASAGGTVDADLSWDEIPVGEAYQVNYVAPGLLGLTTPVLTSPGVTIQNLRANATYSWRVRVQCGGEWSPWPMTFETFATPGGSSCEVTSGFTANVYVNASAGGTIDADLSWADVPAGEAYEVNYIAPGTSSTTPILTHPNVTLQDLEMDKTYSWRIRVQCGGLWSAWPTIWQVFHTPSPPAPPGELYLTFLGPDEVQLSWGDTEGETRFSIERSTNAISGFSVVGTTSPGRVQYRDQGLAPNTRYYYRVRALGAGGGSGYSPVLEVTTAQDLPANVTQTHQPQYNGNISAVKWQGHGDAQENLYTYHYDPMSRLEAAHYSRGVTMGGTWTAITGQGGFSVHDIQYDLNGNLQQLKRQALETEVKTIDALSYSYPNGNQLASVSDPAGWSGFADRNPGVDYDYDDNGNMIQDLNKEITRITYNHLNLPDTVLKADGSYITYLYDAMGIKLAQEVYDTSNELVKKTEYVGEFIYESAGTPGTELAFIHHDEGRIVPNPVGDGYDYEYYLKDHLGNTRVVFTTNPKTTHFTATMESEAAADEEALFSNLSETRVKFAAASYSPNKVARLDAQNPVGPAISLAVGAGDTVQIEGYAFFEGGTGYSDPGNLPAFVAAVAGAFGGINGSGVPAEQATFNLFDNTYGIIGLQGTDADTIPAAYLNYIYFDQNMTYKRSGFKQVSSSANFSKEYVTFPDDIVIEEPGFIYCFVSMESATGRVFWDDFEVTVVEHPVVQRDDYYPFGLQHDGGFNRVTSLKNKFLYNGKELQDDLDLGWYDYGVRMFDPSIARWSMIDPAADLMQEWSPYNYTFNNPLSYIDPDGAIPWPIRKKYKTYNRKSAPDDYFGNPRTGQGYSADYKHAGVDLNFDGGGDTDRGAPVLATHSGKVVEVAKYTTHNNSAGTYIKIQAPDGSFRTVFMHLDEAKVEVGDVVKEGQEIGTLGGSGYGKRDGHKAHLHYEIRKKDENGNFVSINPQDSNGNLIDPQNWIDNPLEVKIMNLEAGINKSNAKISRLEKRIAERESQGKSTKNLEARLSMTKDWLSLKQSVLDFLKSLR